MECFDNCASKSGGECTCGQAVHKFEQPWFAWQEHRSSEGKRFRIGIQVESGDLTADRRANILAAMRLIGEGRRIDAPKSHEEVGAELQKRLTDLEAEAKHLAGELETIWERYDLMANTSVKRMEIISAAASLITQFLSAHPHLDEVGEITLRGISLETINKAFDWKREVSNTLPLGPSPSNSATGDSLYDDMLAGLSESQSVEIERLRLENLALRMALEHARRELGNARASARPAPPDPQD